MGEAKDDPLGGSNARRNEDVDEDDTFPVASGLCALAPPDRDDGVDAAVAHAGHDAADDYLTEGKRKSLD